MHIEEVKLLFAIVGIEFGIFLPVVFGHRLAQRYIVVFVAAQHKRGGNLHVANLGADDVAPGGVVIFGDSGDVLGIFQIHSLLPGRSDVVVGSGDGARYRVGHRNRVALCRSGVVACRRRRRQSGFGILPIGIKIVCRINQYSAQNIE